MTDTTHSTKPVKEALKDEGFGHFNLSVTRGSGTASGWIEIRYEAEKSAECRCDEIGEHEACRKCQEKHSKLRKEMKQIAVEAIEENDVFVGTSYNSMTRNRTKNILIDIDMK